MKLLACIMLVLVTSQCFANSPVRVTGIGFSNALAREDAFKQAIEIKSRSVLLSERELRNGNINNNISLYSSGYIESFVILEQRQKDNKFYVVMEVVVSESKMAERLNHNTQLNNQFDGLLHYEQHKSLKSRDESKTQILDNILKEYPYNAYVLTSSTYDVYYKNNIAEINLPIKLIWHKVWLSSLNELMSSISDREGNLIKKGNYNIVFIGGSRDIVLGTLIAGSRDHHIFKDQEIHNKIKFFISNNDAQIKTIFLNQYGKVVHKQCHFINSSFYNFKEYKYVAFFTNNTYQTKLKITLPYHLLKDISKYDIKIVAKKDC